MSDPTETLRRKMVGAINSSPRTREELNTVFGPDNVWDTDELSASFFVLGFRAPFAIVQRMSDGKHGTVMFQHHPRFYFDFVEG